MSPSYIKLSRKLNRMGDDYDNEEFIGACLNVALIRYADYHRLDMDRARLRLTALMAQKESMQ